MEHDDKVRRERWEQAALAWWEHHLATHKLELERGYRRCAVVGVRMNQRDIEGG